MLTYEQLNTQYGKYFGYKFPFTGIITEIAFEPVAQYVIMSELRSKQYKVTDLLEACSESDRKSINCNKHTDIWLNVDTGHNQYKIDVDLKLDFTYDNKGILINDKTLAAFNEKIKDNAGRHYIATMVKEKNSKWHLYCCNYSDLINDMHVSDYSKGIRVDWKYITGISNFNENIQRIDIRHPETCHMLYCNWPGNSKFTFLNHICAYFEELYEFMKKSGFYCISKKALDEMQPLEKYRKKMNFIKGFNEIQEKYVRTLNDNYLNIFKQIFKV